MTKLSVKVSLIMVVLSSPLLAYRGDEHVAIGTEAYYMACRSAEDSFKSSTDSAIRERLDLACRAVEMKVRDTDRGMVAYESLMGEWSALAADHTQSPVELMDIKLGDMVVDYRVMTRIAVTNYRHFHPSSVLSWRSQHLESLKAALEASKTTGIELVDKFEQALSFEAFAQHYLQDSFASGHMGFNRVASSNAAALTYHNSKNKRGRCVANLDGESWVTYGDGFLDKSPKGKQHVIHAAARSFYDVLATFISGSVEANRWQGVWFELPAYYQDEEGTTPDSEVTCGPGELFRPLRSVSRPARAVATADAMILTDGTLGGGEPVTGIIVGTSFDFVYTIPLGYRAIQNRAFIGIGTTTRQPGSRASLLDISYLWNVGNSMNGTLSHEIGIGGQYYFTDPAELARHPRSSSRVLYAVSVEMGSVYIRTQIGAAHGSNGSWAPHLSAGLGWVFKSRR